MDISEIAHLLACRVDQLVPELLPAARKVNHEWVCGSLAGEAGKSLSVNAGAKRGVWSDFSAGKGGDALDLVAAVLFADDKGEAIKWAKSWLGLDNLSPDRIKQVRKQVEASSKESEEKAAAEAKKKIGIAQAIFLSALQQIGGSPVDNYLFNRAIDIGLLTRQPSAIRYAPELEYYDEVTRAKSTWAGMVATIVRGSEFVGIHRTYLHKTDYNVWKKAPVLNPKLTLGSWKGGYIPCSRGRSGRAMASAPEGDVVVLAEGIEDALSLAIMYPEYRCLSAVTVGNMANIDLPYNIAEVHIAVDNDGDNPQSAAAIQRAIKKFQNEGRDVYTKRSPHGKDFNDLLQLKIKTNPVTFINRNQEFRA